MIDYDVIWQRRTATTTTRPQPPDNINENDTSIASSVEVTHYNIFISIRYCTQAVTYKNSVNAARGGRLSDVTTLQPPPPPPPDTLFGPDKPFTLLNFEFICTTM